MEIKELDEDLIHKANSASFNGTRGDISEQSYKSYIDEVLLWKIPNNKKQKILDQIHKKYSEILKYEAQHISVIVAGPTNYNSKKLDKSNKILELSNSFNKWFDDLREQAQDLASNKDDNKIRTVISRIKFCLDNNFDPKEHLIELAYLDNQKFIQLYEKYYNMFKWRKNSTIFKVYQMSLEGKVKEIKKEVIFEDENFTAYIEENRAYIKFPMKVQQQLIYALKKKGWWWNSHQRAWSTYLDRVDKNWIESISTKYSQYL